MKRLSTYSLAILVGLILANIPYANAQQKQSVIDLGADIMSRYVWRGLDYGASPSIQPNIEMDAGNFTVGAWGAYTVNSPGVQEIDLYASYTVKNLLTLGMTDYFFPTETADYEYLNYSTEYQHIIEATASFNGTENLPLSIMGGINLVNDPDNSVYIELAYSLDIIKIFLGAGNGFYTLEDPGEEDVFGVVNLGIGTGKNIQVTENYSLPVSASLIANPQANRIHLVFGISF
jgi:hypothetical protein